MSARQRVQLLPCRQQASFQCSRHPGQFRSNEFALLAACDHTILIGQPRPLTSDQVARR